MGWHHRQRNDRSGDRPEPWPEADALCEEAGAYVRGHSAELFIARKEAVPIWALLNGPSHRSRAEVLELAGQVPTDARPQQRWDAVPAAVAAALVVLSNGSPATLAQLQLHRLFPLEQALMGGEVHVRTPGELVHLAVLALYTGRWHCHT